MPNLQWATDDLNRMLANPFYAITFDPGLFGEHEPMVSKKEWVQANTRMIEDVGIEAYLNQLLEVLEGNYPRSED